MCPCLPFPTVEAQGAGRAETLTRLEPGFERDHYVVVDSPDAGGCGAFTLQVFASDIVPVAAVFSPEESQQSFVWIIDESSMTAARRPRSNGNA